MPEMSAQKYVNWFPPNILTKTDAFGVAFPGTSLAQITHILSAQSRILCKRCLYVSIHSLKDWAESCMLLHCSDIPFRYHDAECQIKTCKQTN